MKFLIVSHVLHTKSNDLYHAYAPYVREMNLWIKGVSEISIVAPIIEKKLSQIDIAYQHDTIKLKTIPSIEFTSIKKSILSIFKLPVIFLRIFKACKQTDHIHLRCPGNIGLLGCIVQICFPKKIKTVKYAGNWDPKSKQPFSYRLQKWILSNTFLTRNIKVLVYGNWKNQTKNIKPFFTASFRNTDKQVVVNRSYADNLKFVFIGNLVEGKRPLLTIQIVEKLYKLGKNVTLDVFGDGILKDELNKYLTDNKLNSFIVLHGNKKLEELKRELKTIHFLILPSKSEGWPKAITEAMFFGVIPIATEVSCIPFMLGYGKRGIIIKEHLDDALKSVLDYLENVSLLSKMSIEAANWSQNYTLDKFENEIKKLLN